MLSLKGAHKSFAETPALAGADLALEAGEWLALLGPNGAGKTTLVRAIAGRVRLDQGNLALFGQDLHASARDAEETRRRLGIVPQEIALYPLLDGRENLQAFGRLAGLAGSDLKRRIAWALDWTGLEARSGDPVKNFSGGMQRRLNIAASVLHRPEVLLLDEPTVGVDPQSRERIWQMLEGLRSEGTALLLTTHQLDEAQQVAERIVILDHGRTVAAGSFDDLVHQTIGAGRHLRFTLAEVPTPTLAAALGQDGFTLVGQQLQARADHVGRDLPPLLERLRLAGASVEDLQIEAPTLQAVFLHLTGRELRE